MDKIADSSFAENRFDYSQIPHGHKRDTNVQVLRADKSYLLYLQFWLMVYAAGLLPGIIVLSIVGIMALSYGRTDIISH
ncbi:MAG: hypothetical protein IPM69_19505 [Ignavibacteria bacterium]|nr:hypothetical protein [Ignavibacteria bacterium]